MIRPWYWPKGGQPHRTEPFTWIIKGKMAASWWPDPSVMKKYVEEGINVIVNASEFDYGADISELFTYYHIDIPDFGIPTDSQIEHFLEITDRHNYMGDPIAVHCVAGCGRTGQLIVVWAAHNGYIPENTDPVSWIRNIRKCCLETREQVNFAMEKVQQYRSS